MIVREHAHDEDGSVGRLNVLGDDGGMMRPGPRRGCESVYAMIYDHETTCCTV